MVSSGRKESTVAATRCMYMGFFTGSCCLQACQWNLALNVMHTVLLYHEQACCSEHGTKIDMLHSVKYDLLSA